MTICDDFDSFDEARESVMEQRHPGINRPSFEQTLTDSHLNNYGRLNEALHSKIQAAAIEQFGDDAQYVTYQNWDWYGPNYECYVSVINDHLTTEFVDRLQGLLRGDLETWAIVVKLWGDFYDAGTEGGEIVIVSDDVLLERKWYALSGLSS